MEFRIADTFTDSLARLTGEEQKAVKTAAFDLQLNPANPGLSFHKLEKARDKNFWSVRVGRDIRLIVHRSESSLLLCFVGHHDRAYDWAERRKLETHPRTGAAQLVEVRETVREVVRPTFVDAPAPAVAEAVLGHASSLFGERSDEELLRLGVPAEWLPDVKTATEATILTVADHLPAEAAEALLEIATGGKPRVPAAPSADPFEHPDAQRRFRIMTNVEELERALEFPWEKWTIFLHPDQRELVEQNFGGPARISGSAGTGKTIVAIHRAAFLARSNPEARVLLSTFSEPLANALRVKLRRLLGDQPRLGERIDVYSLEAIGQRLYKSLVGVPTIADRGVIRSLMEAAAAGVTEIRFGVAFLMAEWDQIVDDWQISDWEGYRDVARLGRKTRLSERQRGVLWSIFENVRATLAQRGLLTRAGMFTRVAEALTASGRCPFDHVVVDESQDVSVAQLRMLAALGGNRPNSLFFAGDLGQRIFQQPFSWKSLGVDIRGRSRNLRVNYRTSHQIRLQADRLLDPAVVDVDGIREERLDTVSVFNGPPPLIKILGSEDDEASLVAEWLMDQAKSSNAPHEMAIFVRSPAQVSRARSATEKAAIPSAILDDQVATRSGHVSIATMHLAKGLEFKAVAVMACDDEVIPLQARIEEVGDDADLREVYDTERHLLYVACTRARETLLVTAVAPGSEFLADLTGPRLAKS